jgi:hypothetical protein
MDQAERSVSNASNELLVIEHRRVHIGDAELSYPIYSKEDRLYTRLQDLRFIAPNGETISILALYPHDIEIRLIPEKARACAYYRSAPYKEETDIPNDEHVGVLALETTTDVLILLHELGHFSQAYQVEYGLIKRLHTAVTDAAFDRTDPATLEKLTAFLPLVPSDTATQLSTLIHAIHEGIAFKKLMGPWAEKLAESERTVLDARTAFFRELRKQTEVCAQSDSGDAIRKELRQLIANHILEHPMRGVRLEVDTGGATLQKIDIRTKELLWSFRFTFSNNACAELYASLKQQEAMQEEARRDYWSMKDQDESYRLMAKSVQELLAHTIILLERDATRRALLVKRLLRDHFGTDIDPDGAGTDHLLHYALNTYGGRSCINPLDPIRQSARPQASTPDHP